jgi:cobalt-zinc-cadmium efflux system outer membrane protein
MFGQTSSLPDAPLPVRILVAQAQSGPPAADQQTPGSSQIPDTTVHPVSITIEQAIDFARRNNPSIQASRTLIQQNKAQEITANLRPNPVISWDLQYLPIFQPSLFGDATYWEDQTQYDAGIGYLFERGKKRQHRLQAARDLTAVTESQVADTERLSLATVTQQYVAALLAKSNVEFTDSALQSFRHTINLSEERLKAGAMSKADLLKIHLQGLSFETDANTAKLAYRQALNSLRQSIGFDSVPPDYTVAGELSYEPVSTSLDTLEARANGSRPDLQAAQRNVTAAQSQIALAKANGKQDLNVTFDYSHANNANLGAFYFNIPWALFNKNQGEIERTQYAFNQAQFQEKATTQAINTDVRNAYDAVRSNDDIVQLYQKGYIDQAKQSLEITQFSYEHGAASLLDFLDAERSYRSTELSYRQALANYMNALEQLRAVVGTRDLY